ncbi:SPOSA6832_01691, partial [Sporobolomyces salmonicolor]
MAVDLTSVAAPKFLTPEEKRFVIARVDADRGDAEPDKMTFSKALHHAYFLPVILSGGGYDRKTSLLLSAPPYVVAAFYTFLMAYLSDKFRRRALFIGISATSLLIMCYGDIIGVRYFGSFLAISGCQSNVPAALTYQANNVRSHSKRAVASAICVGMGGVGGIFASTVYRERDYPEYLPGLWATVGCQWAILAILTAMSFFFKRRNAQADRGNAVLEEREDFRYML